MDRHSSMFQQKLKSGEYKTIGGIFDTQTENILSATAWQSQKLDDELNKLERVSVLRNLN